MSGYTMSQVALQLYTMRDQCQTLPDVISTFKKVRAIGYEAVQVSGIRNVPYPDIRKALDDAGLIACATHEPGEMILDQPEEVSERLNILGCKETAYPFPAKINFGDPAALQDFVRRLDASGAVLAKHGHTLSYHNHGLEFARCGQGTILDYIYASTNPAYLKAELDTYWVQYGGGDSVAWIEKLAGRMPLIHFKDYAFIDGKPAPAEIGSGNLDWKRIIAASKKAGCQWLIIEQDTCPGDPFDSIRQSYEYLRGLIGA